MELINEYYQKSIYDNEVSDNNNHVVIEIENNGMLSISINKDGIYLTEEEINIWIEAFNSAKSVINIYNKNKSRNYKYY